MAVPQRLFLAASPTAPTMPATVVAHDVTPGLIYQDERVRVTAVENSHYFAVHIPPADYGKDRSYSLRFDTRYGSVVFSGDTGPSDELADLAKAADIFVCEIIDTAATIAALRSLGNSSPASTDKLIAHMEQEHLSPVEVGNLAARAQVKMLVLSHYTRAGEIGSDMTPWTEDIHANFHGVVVPGRDLSEFDLN